MKKNVTAVCISDKEETWLVPEIPFYCHTEGYQYSPHYPPVKTRERIAYLSSRRNAANKRALEQYPETEHILSIDSYNVHNLTAIRQLVKEYSDYRGECILGATTWRPDYSRVPMKRMFFDIWATPELAETSYDYSPNNLGMPKGWEKVRGCGGFALYPRWVWEKQGYGVPEPFPDAGNEVNYLCQHAGIPCYITFNVKLFRELPGELIKKPLVNRIRTTLALRTRLGVKPQTWKLDDGLKWSTVGVSDATLAYSDHEFFLRGLILTKGKTFLDVGAHVGTWAIRASRYYDQVVAIEANRSALSVLERNIELNGIRNVRAIWGAASDTSGELSLFTFDKSSWTSTRKVSMQHSSAGRRILVPSFPVDMLELQPTLVKIDTEGHEVSVLRGMTRTLKSRPKLIVEIHDNLSEVTAFLESAGYSNGKKVETLLTQYLLYE